MLVDGHDLRDVTRALAARPDGHRAAGGVPVQRHGPREHRLRAARTRRARRSRRPPGRSARTSSSPRSSTATTPRSASAACSSRPASASSWPSPARWPPTRASSSSTRRPPTSTSTPRGGSRPGLRRLLAGPHRDRHRPPPLHDPPRRPHRRARPRPHRRAGHARRAAGRRGRLLAPVPRLGRAGRRGLISARAGRTRARRATPAQRTRGSSHAWTASARKFASTISTVRLQHERLGEVDVAVDQRALDVAERAGDVEHGLHQRDVGHEQVRVHPDERDHRRGGERSAWRRSDPPLAARPCRARCAGRRRRARRAASRRHMRAHAARQRRAGDRARQPHGLQPAERVLGERAVAADRREERHLRERAEAGREQDQRDEARASRPARRARRRSRRSARARRTERGRGGHQRARRRPRATPKASAPNTQLRRRARARPRTTSSAPRVRMKVSLRNALVAEVAGGRTWRSGRRRARAARPSGPPASPWIEREHDEAERRDDQHRQASSPRRRSDRRQQLARRGRLAERGTRRTPSGLALPGRDSNPNYQSQNLACCQLHHPARGGGQYSSGVRRSAAGAGPEPAAALARDRRRKAQDARHGRAICFITRN